MVVGYGVAVPNGHLPVFSVDTEKEAEQLLTLACETNLAGDYIARELALHQSLKGLSKFSTRLAHMWFDVMGKEPERKIQDGDCRAPLS